MLDSKPEGVCPKCGGDLVHGKGYCPSCGLAVVAEAERSVIDPYIQARISQELSTRLKDQRYLVRELSDEVENVVWTRLKRYGWITTLFLVLLGAWGLKSIDDAGNKITETADKRVEPVIQSTESRAKAVQENIAKTADRVTELNRVIDGKTQTLVALEPKLKATEDKLAAYDKRMQAYDAKILKSGTQALAQVDSLTKTSTTTLSEIAQLREKVERQQKELTETGTLVKELATRSLLEGFKRGDKASDFVTVTRTPNSHAVAMRLTKVPYAQTVRVQWNLAVQPPDAYFVVGNVVVLPYWEDSIDKFSERTMFVSYIADANPAPQTQFFKALSVRDNAVYGDTVVLLPSLPPRAR